MVEAPGSFVQAVVPFLAGSQVNTERERFEAGLARRKEALGAPHVESRLRNATANTGFHRAAKLLEER